MRHAGCYLGNRCQKNNVHSYLLPCKDRQIRRLECSLGVCQILNANISKKLGRYIIVVVVVVVVVVVLYRLEV